MRPGCWPTCCASRGGRGAASMSDAAEPGRTRLLAWARLAITLVVLGGAWAFLVSNFRPSLIFLNTMTGGGDTPSYHHPIEHLRDVLPPAALCHPGAFLNATVPPLFFLLDRQRFARNLRYLLRVYVTAVLLMGFWLFPLMAKIGYATSINWTWHFQSWREILPKVLQPIAVLAALDVLWVIVRPTPATRAGRYVLFGIVVTAIAFYNAT